MIAIKPILFVCTCLAFSGFIAYENASILAFFLSLPVSVMITAVVFILAETGISL